MNLPTPNYFLLDHEGNLHGYDRVDLLKCDLAMNQENPPKGLFRLNQASLTISYNPITIAELTSNNSQSLHRISTLTQAA